MKTAMALLLTFPLFACEDGSVLDRPGEALDDTGDEIAGAIDNAREEEDLEEIVN